MNPPDLHQLHPKISPQKNIQTFISLLNLYHLLQLSNHQIPNAIIITKTAILNQSSKTELLPQKTIQIIKNEDKKLMEIKQTIPTEKMSEQMINQIIKETNNLITFIIIPKTNFFHIRLQKKEMM